MLQISQWENEVRAAQAGKKWENERMREWENEKMRKWENGVDANNANNQLWQSLKLCQSLRWKSDVLGTVRRIRKKTEKFGRREGGFLMKKGCKEGRVSL